MTDCLSTTYLHRSEIVAIRDVRCRAAVDTHCGAEETSDADTLVFPRAGVFVKHSGREEIVGDANQVLFFRRDEPYRVSHPIHGGDDCTVFEFAPAVLREAVSGFEPRHADRDGSAFPHTQAPSDKRVFFTVQALRRELTHPRDGLAADEIALGILARTVGTAYGVRGRQSHSHRPDTIRAHRDMAHDARLHLIAHFRQRLTLAEVAGAVHTSPFHLARVFRKDAGMPIHRFLNALRLRAALERLADGEDDLSRLALALGYASHSHFGDAFRVEFGIPPSGFRGRRHLLEMSKIPEARGLRAR